MFTASQRLKNKTYELRPVRVQWSYLCYNSQSRPGSDNGPMLSPVENVSVVSVSVSCIQENICVLVVLSMTLFKEALQKFEKSNYALD